MTEWPSSTLTTRNKRSISSKYTQKLTTDQSDFRRSTWWISKIWPKCGRRTSPAAAIFALSCVGTRASTCSRGKRATTTERGSLSAPARGITPKTQTTQNYASKALNATIRKLKDILTFCLWYLKTNWLSASMPNPYNNMYKGTYTAYLDNIGLMKE